MQTKNIPEILLIALGVLIFAYGATTGYQLASDKPYHYTASVLEDDEDIEEEPVSFDELSENEKNIFLRMIEGESHASDVRDPPVGASVVEHRNEVFRIRLSEVREPAVYLQYIFYFVSLVGMLLSASGVRRLKQEGERD